MLFLEELLMHWEHLLMERVKLRQMTIEPVEQEAPGIVDRQSVSQSYWKQVFWQ